jgi:hypothetical protein
LGEDFNKDNVKDNVLLSLTDVFGRKKTSKNRRFYFFYGKGIFYGSIKLLEDNSFDGAVLRACGYCHNGH